MTDKIAAAVERLNRQLPLAQRQQSLPAELAELHRTILRRLFDTGRPPNADELDADDITQLTAADLIVAAADGSIAGAYPMTVEPTPHRLRLPGRSVHAMCALDALSVTPMFGGSVEIESQCRVTATPVRIRQEGRRILAAAPEGVLVGVGWQMPCGGHAAHSMCVEMVFLKDASAAEAWHRGDLENHSVFSLEEAVDFGARFFCPLLT